MARRKNAYLSDGSDSDASAASAGSSYNSQEDGDSRAERRLFEHKGQKRRKTGRSGKDYAWEGIFGADDEPRSGLGGRQRNGGPTDWTKAPSFVAKSRDAVEEDLEQPMNGVPEDEDQQEEDSDGGEEESDEEDEDSRPASPRVREEEDEGQAPPRQGMGMGNGNRPPGFAANFGVPTTATPDEAIQTSAGRAGIGSGQRGGRGGIGSSRNGVAPVSLPDSAESSAPGTPRGGIGSASAPNAGQGSTSPNSVPSAFGRPAPVSESIASSSRPERFKPRPAPARSADLTSAEATHFSKISSSFGAKFLAKQGWEAGKGLGINEDGRAIPVAVGKLFKGQGITKGMRTEDSKREARRKGEKLSDDEEEQPRRRGGARGPRPPGQPPEQGWKKQRKVKVKVEHKTYEQIVSEAGESSGGVGLVLDARGGDVSARNAHEKLTLQLKEVSSLSALSLSSWTPTGEAMQLPELRHNLRLIVDVAKGDVDALAKEGRSVNEKRRWAAREEEMAKQKVDEVTKRAF